MDDLGWFSPYFWVQHPFIGGHHVNVTPSQRPAQPRNVVHRIHHVADTMSHQVNRFLDPLERELSDANLVHYTTCFLDAHIMTSI